MKAATIKAAIEIGYDFSEIADDHQFSDVKQNVVDFLVQNVEKLPALYEECEVTGFSPKQNVSWGDYSSTGEIIDWSYYYDKERQKINHSSCLHIDEDGNPFKMVLWCWSKNETEIDDDFLTCDVVFDDNENSNAKGFKKSLEYCKSYIDQYNGTNESYFKDYKGGTVSIVKNVSGLNVYSTTVK